jgi:hypothetical protein
MKVSLLGTIASILLSTISLLLVVLLASSPWILFVCLIILVILINFIYPKPLLFYLLCAIGGACAESFAIYFSDSTWRYVLPTPPFNIPLWIMPIWANAAIFMVGVHTLMTGSFLSA